jgi:hypothetical protein
MTQIKLTCINSYENRTSNRIQNSCKSHSYSNGGHIVEQAPSVVHFLVLVAIFDDILSDCLPFPTSEPESTVPIRFAFASLFSRGTSILLSYLLARDFASARSTRKMRPLSWAPGALSHRQLAMSAIEPRLWVQHRY